MISQIRFLFMMRLTLPVGRMKISKNNGDGGHNGVRSVFSNIGSNLVRLRLGIGSEKKIQK